MDSNSKLKKNFFTLIVITIAGAMIYGLPYFRSYFYDAYLSAYNLTNTQMGMFGAMFGVFGMISYLFGGVVADMVPPKILMSISLILTGVGGFLHLMNPNYTMLLAIYSMWGLTSLFAFWPSLLKSLREIANENEQSKAYGFMDGGRGIVYAIDGTLIVAIFAYFSKVSGDIGGLNGVITYYSVIAVVLGILVYLLLNKAEKNAPKVENEEHERITLKHVGQVLKLPAVWILSAILCCTYVMNIAFYYFTPYATSRFGMAAAAGAFITVAAQYVRPLASFGGGIVGDKFGRSKVLYVTFSMMAIGTLLMIVLPNMSSTLFTILCILVYIGMYGGYSLVFSMMEEGGIPLKLAGTAIGIVCTLGYLPEMLVPLVSGQLLDVYKDEGYRIMFIGITIIMVIGFIMVRVWDKYLKKYKEREKAQALETKE
ncbi:MFS transporter [Guggenheimella bovis]